MQFKSILSARQVLMQRRTPAQSLSHRNNSMLTGLKHVPSIPPCLVRMHAAHPASIGTAHVTKTQKAKAEAMPTMSTDRSSLLNATDWQCRIYELADSAQVVAAQIFSTCEEQYRRKRPKRSQMTSSYRGVRTTVSPQLRPVCFLSKYSADTSQHKRKSAPEYLNHTRLPNYMQGLDCQSRAPTDFPCLNKFRPKAIKNENLLRVHLRVQLLLIPFDQTAPELCKHSEISTHVSVSHLAVWLYATP